jgi:4-carboxymuconolactone decarboxylase
LRGFTGVTSSASTTAENTMELSPDPETQAGLATRRAVLGADYVQGALDRATPFTAPLQELVTRHAWGNTWQRDGIDLRTRSIVTVSMLVALGRMHELKIHVRGALNNGVTREELQEIFLHASVYCGFPAAVDAFRNAAEVVEGK